MGGNVDDMKICYALEKKELLDRSKALQSSLEAKERQMNLQVSSAATEVDYCIHVSIFIYKYK